MLKAVNLIDYETLWRDMVILGEQRRARKTKTSSADQWHGKATEFAQRVNDRWLHKDSSRDFVKKTLLDNPRSSVLDIGAGSGAWVSFIAPHASWITAIDPSDSMLRQLENRVNTEKLQNVKIIKGCWPDVQVEPHDISFCSHAMYGVENFVDFIKAMHESTLKRIILLIRAPKDDGLMAQAAKLVWGHPFDSPNYQIAINILWKMGIFPNVIMEDDHLWKPWSHPSLEDALSEMKNRLGLFDSLEWDEKLRGLLASNLQFQSGEYIWPSAIRTALLYWDM
ncbi:MAG: SAM-dependent methyltransferase [Chloroflexi bacterium HGW-Chloroflexi-3]|nr:MAG: SAM-dependent methyltransferase [Chloroflexi bacterium HGW-Chloroflexi-3]